MKEVILIKAVKEDAKVLKNSQVITFLDDNQNKPEGVSLEMPPGCDSLQWNTRRIEENEVYKIMVENVLVGGFIIFEKKKNDKVIGRVWIEPEYQNKGIGRMAFENLFTLSTVNTSWYLETPEWAVRNHHFYERLGFKKIGETEFDKFCGWKEYKYKQGR
jgi:GNAT superfamily N-acetyltransferase